MFQFSGRCNANSRSLTCFRSIALGLLTALIVVSQLAAGLNLDRLLATLKLNGGATEDFRNWQQLIVDTAALPTGEERLRRVNTYFNRVVTFTDDMEIWGQSDYWATPMETLGKRRGDCEDYTIAKYFTLLEAGIPPEQLRLVYVKARIGGPNSSIVQAHMVLAFYPTPDAEPWVLDNLITDIRPASRRPDLTPVFSFNSDGIWAGSAGTATKGSSDIGRLSRWQDLLRRVRAEGFD